MKITPKERAFTFDSCQKDVCKTPFYLAKVVLAPSFHYSASETLGMTSRPQTLSKWAAYLWDAAP
jgi:hypothetical protein